MGRPRFEAAPEIKAVPQSGDAERDLWDYIRRSLHRLALGQPHGFGVEIANEWIRLDSTTSPCLKRVEHLRRFAIERGSRERDVDRVIEHARRLVADGVWRTSQQRHDEMRARLTVGSI